MAINNKITFLIAVVILQGVYIMILAELLSIARDESVDPRIRVQAVKVLIDGVAR
jgi:hypothetical protein